MKGDVGDKGLKHSKSDFVLKIDFARGVGSPSRVFVAAKDMIDALQSLDRALIKSIDAKIDTSMALEEIESGSIKIHLRQLLSMVDDQALNDGEWKKVVGRFLLKTKYIAIAWLDNKDEKRSLLQLGSEIRQVASETDIKYLPDYSAPTAADLVSSLTKINEAKKSLLKEDRMTLDAEGQIIEFDLLSDFDGTEFENRATNETINSPSTIMILAVKKPDYLGDSKWHLRIGKKNVFAKIEDANWLKRFQNREVDVRPGDALKCKVEVESKYGFDNELIAENYQITEVIDVLANKYKQLEFAENDF